MTDPREAVDSAAWRLGTRATHAGQSPDPSTGAVMVPIYATSTYAQSSPGVDQGFEYSRTHNPTRSAYERCEAGLERGSRGFAFASGLAASSTVLELLDSGDHVIAMDDLYGGSYRLFEGVRRRSAGLDFSFVDLTDPAAFEAAITPKTRMVWVETPTNPTLKIVDLQAISAIARRRGLITVVDNTFLSPALYRPLEHGADLVLHSATKYLSGHSNMIGGMIAGSRETVGAIRRRIEQLGGIMAPQTAWQLMQGVKTLPLRMAQHSTSALAVAEAMAAHPAVEAVNYPGLPEHPGHEMAAGMTGNRFSGMVSLRLADHARSRNVFLDALEIPYKAVSLGGVESLVWPFDGDGVIRLSVGIEDTADLVADVTQALDAVS